MTKYERRFPMAMLPGPTSYKAPAVPKRRLPLWWWVVALVVLFTIALTLAPRILV